MNALGAIISLRTSMPTTFWPSEWKKFRPQTHFAEGRLVFRAFGNWLDGPDCEFAVDVGITVGGRTICAH